MKILVIGGTGTVGSQTVGALLARNADVRVLTSSGEKVSKLPKGVEGVVGNLRNKDSLVQACRGVERLFLITPMSQTETEEGLNTLNVAKSAGVKRMVYMSIHCLEDIPGAPHFASKIPIENAIKSSGMSWTFIRPNNFFQNDYWLKQAIVEYGSYPQPIGNVGVHRVDVRDIAETVVHALLDSGHEGKTYSLVGPDPLTGDICAAAYSRHLGKPVRYGGEDLNAWAAQAKQMVPEWMVEDLRIMFDHFQKKGLLATPEHHAETERILGKKPRSFDSFVAEVVRAWKA